MLSIENPLQDPSCSSQFRSYSDQKASDNGDNGGHPFPKFSIRDYVFCTRGEDMNTNWPFSQKSLQHCMNHGLKEMLPPFQFVDDVRDPSRSSFKGEIDPICKNEDNLCDQDQLLYCSSENPSVSFFNNELDSNTKSLSKQEVEASDFREPLIDKSEVVLRRALKKRSRMIMKSSKIPHTSAKEDSDVNALMAVCPICRVFSSSSNTTLNAHIDQCLSNESTTKDLRVSKFIKHRIKPRKMRSMVDIYKTAIRCTLEDLDARNGTTWASNLGLFDDNNKLIFEKNPVYIDANGTKLCILYKKSDLNNDSMDLDGPQSRKHTNGDEDSGSRLLLPKKTKKNMLKHSPLEETNANEKCTMKQLIDPNKVKFSKTETIRRWVCSKRSGLTKKIDHGNLRENRNSSSSDTSDINPQILSISSQRIDIPPHDESRDHLSSLKKRMKLSIVESPVHHNQTKSLALEVLAEHGINQLDGGSPKDFYESSRSARLYEENDDTSETLLSAKDNIDSNNREKVVVIDLSSEDEDQELRFVVSRNYDGFSGLATQTDVHCQPPRCVEKLREPLYEGQGNYLDEVDPIPIPGPPGSFLPSPGRMESNNLQGISSLISARFLSSVECQEFVNHSSESPAATSTNSISTFPRSGSKQSEYCSSLCELNRRLDDVKSCNGERSVMSVDNDNIPVGNTSSLRVSVDSQVSFCDNGYYEMNGPPATPVLRLMGKNLMVINRNENDTLLKPFSHANLQTVCGHESSLNIVHQTDKCNVNSREHGRGNFGNLAMPQTAYMNRTMFSTQSIDGDSTRCLIYPEHPDGYSLPNMKVQPATKKHGTPSPVTFNMLNPAHQLHSVRRNNGDISSNTIRKVITMDDTRDGTQGRYKDARYSGFLFDANTSTPSGINSYPF